MKNKKFIILEIIPTSIQNGLIAQLQALKVDGIKIVDRFDYRIEKSIIRIPDIVKMLDFDNDMFTYVETNKEIMEPFKKFIDDLPLLIIDNEYTINYLKDIKNEKESIFNYFDIKVDNNSFDKLIKKYKLEPSNHLVDLLYEALIKEM